jgi:hypothetical protein
LLAALGGTAAVPSRSSSTRTGGQVPLSVVSIRSFRLRDVALGTGAERIPVSLDAALTGDRLTLSSAVVRVTGATLHAAGELSIARREGDFTVRSDVLPVAAVLGALKGLAPPQAASRSGSQEPRPAPYRLTVQITSPVAIIGAHRAESFEARLDASPAGIVVDPVTFGLAGGRFEARVTLDASQPVASVDYRGRLSGFDVARLQQATGARKAALAGRLDAAFALEAPLGAEMAALLDEARGTVSIDIRDGRMPGIEVVRRAVIRFANRAEPAPQVDASDAFSQLQASLTLRPGPARITRLTMRAEDFDLAGDGTLAPTDWAIALAANVTLTEALSQQAGRDLYRYAREGRRIVLPVIVGGTLFEPTASIDVGSAAGRALRNRIEEEARSLLERVMKRRQPNPSKP